jgi:hypothetical protein
VFFTGFVNDFAEHQQTQPRLQELHLKAEKLICLPLPRF